MSSLNGFFFPHFLGVTNAVTLSLVVIVCKTEMPFTSGKLVGCKTLYSYSTFQNVEHYVRGFFQAREYTYYLYTCLYVFKMIKDGIMKIV